MRKDDKAWDVLENMNFSIRHIYWEANKAADLSTNMGAETGAQEVVDALLETWDLERPRQNH